ncbi:MAG: 5-(carboxyamino)imidazole ribonucleotide mutase [Candidatus Glassbacteria bacterium]
MPEEVLILMGSESDRKVMALAEDVLREAGVGFSTHVSSAHRDPDGTRRLVEEGQKRGVKIIIAGAGMSAALPGYCASFCKLPVIGVPIAAGALSGLDSLLAIAQMPPGVPVATVGIDGANNAAHLALRILEAAKGG